MPASKNITVTEQDVARLSEVILLCSDLDESATESLQQKLDRARVVKTTELESSVVTMNSRVVCRDERGASRELQVVYPRDANAAEGRISVLAPLGRALLGASVGQHVEVASGGKSVRTWVIEEIRYQPEAAGDEHL
jgi:regulator of nucleoside diphosphate kinase